MERRNILVSEFLFSTLLYKTWQIKFFASEILMKSLLELDHQ